MAWEGHVVAIEDDHEKRQRCEASVMKLTDSAQKCRQAGLEIEIVSCGGSGSYLITSRMPGVTEIQAGGAIFTDVTYKKWGVPLDISLFVRSTIVSRPQPTRAVCDAGRKTIDYVVSNPLIVGYEDIVLDRPSAEHGAMTLPAENPLKVGDQIDLMVSYGDFTVHKHRIMYGVRSGVVETQWDILGSGALQ